MTKVCTRFAPSPTGHLHLGHAYSAILAYNAAKKTNGCFLLRIEDIDYTRCKKEYIDDIYTDLEWLGLEWEEPVRIQSKYLQDYQNVLQKLEKLGVIYPCFCTRKDIQREIKNAGYAPHELNTDIYPGTCRSLSTKDVAENIAQNKNYSLRINIAKSLALIKREKLFWTEEHSEKIQAEPETLGDIIIARKDIQTSYHLSVVVDDYLQGITHIIRGEDLKFTTHIHCLLQDLLGYKRPIYQHHQLLLDPSTGKRFAKRDQSKTLKSMRASGLSVEDIYKVIGINPIK